MVARLLLTGLLILEATAILTAQHVGINMPTPAAPLHVVRNVPTSGPKSNHVMAILESDDESFIQLSSAANAATGFLSGDRWTSIRSSLIFGGDSSIVFKSGGDISRMFLSNKGRLGINTTAPLAQLHVKDSSVVFEAPFPPPAFPVDPPVSGAGCRMMWYPDKAAFRSGTVLSTKWDKANIGNHSIALGLEGMANGVASTALGLYGIASGEGSTTMGYGGQARGNYSLAHNWTIAKSFACFVTGTFNDTTSNSSVIWHANDPLFIVGNGTDYSNRNNALTVLKNGKTGINTHNPQSMLHVIRNGTSAGPYAVNAIATFESNSSSWIHLKHPNTAQAAILSGNEETTVRSGLLFDVDSSMLFRTGGNYTRMKLSKTGYLGLNTTSPKSLLHIRLGGNSGGPIHPLAFATLESNVNGYLQFSQSTNAEGGFLSGNSVTEIRSAIVFGIDSSLHLRTGGNINRLFIDQTGKTGIGTSTPKSLLHLYEGNPGGGIVHPESSIVVEKDTNACIQLITPSEKWSGIISTTPGFPLRSGVIFDDDKSLDFLTGGSSVPQVTITSIGRVGINATNPTALLHVAGDFRFGHWGTNFENLIQKSFPIDLPVIAGGASYTVTLPIAPLDERGTVHVSPAADLPDGIIIAYARAMEDAVKVKFTNITAAGINVGNMEYFFTVMQ